MATGAPVRVVRRQVTDHAARERRHDREDTEADGIEVSFSGDLAAEDAIEENAP